MAMSRVLQKLLLVAGVIALLALLVEIGLSVAATTHGSTPARVVHVKAGPYPLTVNLYQYPANAGFALPFAIAPQQAIPGTLSYTVSSLPGKGVSATPVRSSISTDSNVQNGIQGSAEVTVQGSWQLIITVSGPAGQGTANVPFIATAPPALPAWIGWVIGSMPLVGLLIFALMQQRKQVNIAPMIN